MVGVHMYRIVKLILLREVWEKRLDSRRIWVNIACHGLNFQNRWIFTFCFRKTRRERTSSNVARSVSYSEAPVSFLGIMVDHLEISISLFVGFWNQIFEIRSTSLLAKVGMNLV